MSTNQRVPAADFARGDAVDGARALQPLAVPLEPVALEPVSRLEMLEPRQAVARGVEVALVAGRDVPVVHAQDVGRGRAGGQRRCAGAAGPNVARSAVSAVLVAMGVRATTVKVPLYLATAPVRSVTWIV